MSKTETQDERISKGITDLQNALEEYIDQDFKDLDLSLIHDLTWLLRAQAAQAAKIAAEALVINLDDRYAFYHHNYYEARQGIITKLVDAAATIARDYPSLDGRWNEGEWFTNTVTSILKQVDYAKVNTRADLLIKYAHDVDTAMVVDRKTDAAAERDYGDLEAKYNRLKAVAANVAAHKSSKKAFETLAKTLEDPA